MSKQDPKHGRWILPLVIAGLVGLTYSFVNALPPAEVPLGTTTVTTPSTTLPPETTTTTLPPEIEAFLILLDGYQTTATEIQMNIDETNDAWEKKDIVFSETLTRFTQSQVDAQTLSDSVTATNPPAAYATEWPMAVTAAEALPLGVDAVIDGLRAPDDGSLRRAAVGDYAQLTADFVSSLDGVRAATPN
ncbi:MAG: hypothetical protein BMS9Abin07_1110 [Acidimicrobiia bacterium]|nr:MAG: hypothetical protein BMS9Abin07_1110 [Acidimicrobiia bacterium]